MRRLKPRSWSRSSWISTKTLRTNKLQLNIGRSAQKKPVEIGLPGFNRSGGDHVRMPTTKMRVRFQTGPATIAGQVESVFSQPCVLLHAGKPHRLFRNMKDLCLVQSGLHGKDLVLHLLHRLEHRLVYALKKLMLSAVTTEKLPTAL